MFTSCSFNFVLNWDFEYFLLNPAAVASWKTVPKTTFELMLLFFVKVY